MKDFSSFITEARSGGRDEDGKKIKNRIEPVSKTGKKVSELRGGAKSSAINRLRRVKEKERASEQGNEETKEERRERLRGELRGKRALEAIQKENKKEKHEKKKAIGKAGVKELKKTQEGGKVEKKMEAGLRDEHNRKKETGRRGSQQLKKTFSDVNKEIQKDSSIQPTSIDDIKSAAKKRVRKKLVLSQRSKPRKDRMSAADLRYKSRKAQEKAKPGIGDVVRAKVEREKKVFKRAPFEYTKNVAGKTINRTVKPVAKLAKSVATASTRSGTTQASGDSDVSVGKGTRKERG